MTAFELIASFGVPLLGLMLARQDRHREQNFKAVAALIDQVHSRVEHVDECFDELKEKVLTNMVSRTELAASQSDTQHALERQRVQIGEDTHGLHERIFRLESLSLSGQNARPKQAPAP